MADRAPAPHQTARFGRLDALRGAALCGMVAYHVEWDLAALGWPVTNPNGSLIWTVFGDSVAATFLVLSGVSLILAQPKGLVAALRRLGTLVLAGAAVTAVSLWFAPGEPILFGILQCLAASNAIVLLMLRWPAPVRLGSAALAVLVPTLWRSSSLGDWPFALLGLGPTPPPTLDFRPLLPWLAAVLIGSVLGEAILRRPALGGKRSAGTAGLRWLGQHSLAIYLAHQPLLYGVLLLASLPFDRPAVSSDPFTLQCRSDCAATGAAPRLCQTACDCAAERLAVEGASREGRSLTLEQRHLDAITQACRAAGG